MEDLHGEGLFTVQICGPPAMELGLMAELALLGFVFLFKLFLKKHLPLFR